MLDLNVGCWEIRSQDLTWSATALPSGKWSFLEVAEFLAIGNLTQSPKERSTNADDTIFKVL